MAWEELRVMVEGTAPYVPNKFTPKAAEQMLAYFERGSKKRAPKEKINPEEEARSRLYVAENGRYGVPAAALRKAVIEAGRFCGYQMKKLSGTIDVLGEDYDRDTGFPLVYLEGGEPEVFVSPVKNTSGTRDLRWRPYFKPGWRCTFTVIYDGDMLSKDDVIELLTRAGMNVGIGDGRPLSPNSPGLGFGRWKVVKVE